jgi:hypothetical protein
MDSTRRLSLVRINGASDVRYGGAKAITGAMSWESATWSASK